MSTSDGVIERRPSKESNDFRSLALQQFHSASTGRPGSTSWAARGSSNRQRWSHAISRGNASRPADPRPTRLRTSARRARPAARDQQRLGRPTHRSRRRCTSIRRRSLERRLVRVDRESDRDARRRARVTPQTPVARAARSQQTHPALHPFGPRLLGDLGRSSRLQDSPSKVLRQLPRHPARGRARRRSRARAPTGQRWLVARRAARRATRSSLRCHRLSLRVS